MNHAVVDVPHRTEIRVRCPGALAEAGPRPRFLARVFEVSAVRSVELDLAAGTAILRLRPDAEVAAVLTELAATLAAAPKDPPAHPGYVQLPRRHGPLAFVRAPRTLTGLRKTLYRALGVVFSGLSVVGVISPFVPTTPFVLLSGYFLARSSPALHERLTRARVFGPILDDFYVHGGLRWRLKRNTLLLMAAVFGAFAALTGFAPAPMAAMGLVSLASVALVLGLPTVREPKPDAVLAA